MKTIQNIPVVITISRETGQVMKESRAEVPAEDFRRICSELMKGGKRDRAGMEKGRIER